MLIQYIMNPWYMLFVFTIFLKLTTLGTYAPSFGALCAAAFEAERERAPEKNIRRPEDLIERVRPAAQRQQILSGYCSFFREKR